MAEKNKNIFIKHKVKIVVAFWALWALSFAIMCFYVNLAEGNEIFGLTMMMLALAVFPIVGLILLAIFSVVDTDKKKILAEKQAQRQEEMRIQQEKKLKEMKENMTNEEKNRKSIEEYNTKKFNWKWFIIPLIFSIILSIYCLIAKDSNQYLVGFIVISIFSAIFISDSDDKWEKRLACKAEIFESEKKQAHISGLSDYKHGYLYTDSIGKFYLYAVAKLFFHLASILGVIGIVIIFFLWLGSITIAPTTIIIILLLIIIFNQK